MTTYVQETAERILEGWAGWTPPKACIGLDSYFAKLINQFSLYYFLFFFFLPAKEELCSQYPQLSRVGKLAPKAFQTFLELIASKSTGNEDETIDNLVRFLTTNVEQSHTESLQSSARRKWLQDIQQAAESSGTSIEPVYKAVMRALCQVGILALPVLKESHG